MSIPSTQPSSARRRQTIVATTIGNGLEFFDFTVYGFLALVIGKLFFPTFNSYGQLLLTVASFGVGFVMRPLGGIVIGAYADRAGRKKAMTLTIFLMALGCALIAFTPTYAAIGVAAPIVIVLARLIQGFSAGGEVGASTTLLVEHATPANRGYMASWQFASQGLGVMLGAIVVGALTFSLTPEAMQSWGWRVPFVIGMLIAPVGMYIRRHLEESLHVSAEDASRAAREQPEDRLHAARQDGAGRNLGDRRGHHGRVCRHLLHAHVRRARAWPHALGGAVRRGAHRVALVRARTVRGQALGHRRPQDAHLLEPHRDGDPDLPRLPVAQRLAHAAGAVRRARRVERRARGADGAGHHDAAGDVSQARARKRHVAGLQRGRRALRRLAPFISTWLVNATGSKLAPAWYLVAMTVVSLLGLIWLRDHTGRDIDAADAHAPA
jgi:MHS family proline/betaine transporter-like MFS transporter